MKVGTRVSPRADNADPFETHVGTVTEVDLFGEPDIVMVKFDQGVEFLDESDDGTPVPYVVDTVTYMVGDLIVVQGE